MRALFKSRKFGSRMARSNQRIIVVRNDQSTSLLSDILSDQEYDVSYIGWDDHALERIDRLGGDLVIADLDHPTALGIRICRKLKEQASTKTIPVIIIATLPDLHDKEDAFKAGCYDLIAKPFAVAELIARIGNCLQNQVHLKRFEKIVDDRTKLLKASEARFKNIFLSLSIGGVIYKAIDNGNDFLILDFNPAAEQIEKISKKEVMDQPVTKIFQGIGEFGLLDTLRRVWKSGQPEKHPSVFYKDARVEGWRENEVFKLPSGEIVALYTDVSAPKKNEEKINNNHLFLQKIVDGVSDSLMVINRDFTIALANKTARDMLEAQDPGQVITCHQAFHASAIPCVGEEDLCPFQTVLQTKKPLQVEHIHFDKNGHEHIVEISCSPIFDGKGEIVQLIELSRDITNRKRQDRLKDIQLKLSKRSNTCTNKELVQILLDETEKLTNSRIGFFHFVDKDKPIINYLVRSTNTQKKERCTATGHSGHAPLEEAGVWADCIRKGQPVVHNNYPSLQERKTLPQGHPEIIRELVVPVFHDDRITAVFGIGNKPYDYDSNDVDLVVDLAEMAWDIIARKQAEEQLQATEERCSKMFLSSPDAIVLFRLEDGVVLDVNTTFTQLFQHSRDVSIGKRIRELDLWVDDPIVKTTLSSIKQGRPVRGIEMKGKRASGEIFDVSVSCDGISIDQETCLIALIRNISERKIAEVKNRELERQLHQSRKMESLGTLAGGIAHDFNNILSVIIGYTQLTMSDLSEHKEYIEKLDHVMKASNRAKELVSQILAFSRNDEQELKPLRIQLIVKETIKLLRSSIPSTISIRQAISNDCDMVLADPTQIHQVVMNICTNSYQAMRDKGGQIDITLQQVDIGHGDLCESQYLKPGFHVQLTISDTGPGIPHDLLDRIFEPYYTTKSKGEGTGLGLAVVHGIVTKLNGDIFVKSNPGTLTTFRILLPVVGKSVAKPEKQMKLEIPTGSECILFVDDDEVLVDINKKTLEYFGYQVTAVSSSLEAFNIFQNAPDSFDLIITDMTMPQMTGDKLAEKILGIRPGIPIILATGYSDAINPELAKAKGIKGYLSKPFVQRNLADEIRKCLEKKELKENR